MLPVYSFTSEASSLCEILLFSMTQILNGMEADHGWERRLICSSNFAQWDLAVTITEELSIGEPFRGEASMGENCQ